MLLATLFLLGGFALGMAVRLLFLKAFNPDFVFKKQVWQIVACFVVGITLSLLFAWIGLKGWVGFAIFVVAGFMSKFLAEWLNKQKG